MKIPRGLISFAVFVFVLVVEHREIALVTALGDEMVLDSLEDGTTGFVCVGAVGEAALLGEFEDFAEIAGELLAFHVEGAEAFDAWGVDEPTLLAIGYWLLAILRWGQFPCDGNHFGEGGGVGACLMGFADVGHTLVGVRDETIDERRLANARVAAEERDLAFEQGPQGFDAFARLCRDSVTLIANSLVELNHHLLIVELVVGEQVGLIEYKYHGHAIGLCRRQETVDEGCGGLRAADGDDEQSLIDIGSKDMALLGEVDALADDVVATVLDFRYPGSWQLAVSCWQLAVGCWLLAVSRGQNIDIDAVAYCHRIGRAYPLDAEIALHLTIK